MGKRSRRRGWPGGGNTIGVPVGCEVGLADNGSGGFILELIQVFKNVGVGFDGPHGRLFVAVAGKSRRRLPDLEGHGVPGFWRPVEIDSKEGEDLAGATRQDDSKPREEEDGVPKTFHQRLGDATTFRGSDHSLCSIILHSLL